MASQGSMYVSLGIRLKGIEASQRTMMKVLQTISGEADRTKAKLGGLSTGIVNVQKNLNQVKPVPIVPIVDTAPAITALNKYTTHLFQQAQRWRTFGYLTSIVLTAPMIAAGKAAVDTAGDFNIAMAKIQGLAGIPIPTVKRLKDEILKLAPAVAQTPQALAEGAYFTMSAGFKDAAEGMKVVETAAKMATAGMGSVADNAKVLVYSMNAYRKSGLTAAQAADIFTAAVREGAIETDAFSTAIQSVLPIASSMGVGLDQVAGSMAAMSLQGASAENAAVYLKGMLNSLIKIKPSNQAGKALSQFGVEAQDLYDQLSKPGGLLKVLVQLQELSKQSTGNVFLKDIFSNIRAMTGALSLTGENLENNAWVMEQAANAAGSMGYAYGAVQGQINVVKDRIKALSDVMKIEFGEILANYILPLLEKFVTAMKGLISWFNETSDGFKKLVIGAMGFLVVMGPIALLGSTFKYIWAGTVLSVGKQFIWLRNIVKGLSGDMIAMGNAAAAKKGLTSFLKSISTKALNAGSWAMLAKNIGKTLGAFVGKAGPVGLIVSGLVAGTVALFKYVKNTKDAVKQSEAFHNTLVDVNNELKAFKDLNKEDISAMTLDQMLLTRQTSLNIMTDTYKKYLQAKENAENAPFGAKKQRNNQLDEALENYNKARGIYTQTNLVMAELQAQLVEEKKAHERLAIQEETKKIEEHNQALIDEYQKIKDSISVIDERAKAFKEANKPYDVIKEKAEELLKGIESLTGTEFKLKFNHPYIQQLILMLRDLNYDFTETGKAAAEFAKDLDSSLGSVKMKKGLLKGMYDADAAMLDIYKKGLDDYVNILTSVDEVTGVIIAPTQEQINKLNELIDGYEKYTKIVDNNIDKDTIAILNAEADAFGSIAGKIEVVNYELQAAQRILRDTLKARQKGDSFGSDEEIEKLVERIRVLKGEYVDLQNFIDLQYAYDMDKAFGNISTGTQLLETHISTLTNKLKYLSKEGKGTSEAFKIIAGQVKNLEMTRDVVGVLTDSFSTFFDALIEGGQNMQEVLQGIFKSIIKQLMQLLIEMLAMRILAMLLGGPALSKATTSNITIPKLAPNLPGLQGPPVFAKGGIVPPGFPNDTYPAMLSSHETIIPKGISLDKFRLDKDKTEDTVRFEIDGEVLVGILKKKSRKNSIY